MTVFSGFGSDGGHGRDGFGSDAGHGADVDCMSVELSFICALDDLAW